MKPILRKIDSGQNFSFSIREDIYPYLYKHWHFHPEAELTFIRKGKGTRLVGDHTERFEHGDLVLIGANLPHLWRNDLQYFKSSSKMHVEAVAIHFKEEFWGEHFLNLPELRPVKELLARARRGIKITGKTRATVAAKMEEALGATEAKRISLLVDMLYDISQSKELRLLASPGFTKYYDTVSTDKINHIYSYTFRNFQDRVSIRDVASSVSISPHSFCRYFKTRTLKTYWKFLVEIRIGYACKLLIENNMSVARICYECGFNNLSNFNRHFKSLMKKTPLQYQKEFTGWEEISGK